MELPTALLLLGIDLPFIAGGSLHFLSSGMWQRRSGREARTDGAVPATTAMWPAVWHGGRPTKEDAGPLPAGSTLVFRQSAAEATII